MLGSKLTEESGESSVVYLIEEYPLPLGNDTTKPGYKAMRPNEDNDDPEGNSENGDPKRISDDHSIGGHFTGDVNDREGSPDTLP